MASSGFLNSQIHQSDDHDATTSIVSDMSQSHVFSTGGDSIFTSGSTVVRSNAFSARYTASMTNSSARQSITESGSATAMIESREFSEAAASSSQAQQQPIAIYRLDFDALQLYGRQQEVEALQQALEASKTSRQVVLIKGPAGSGKTTLANTLCPSITACGGFLLSEKYEQQQQQQQQQQQYQMENPHTGIAAACQDFCQQILEYRYDPTSHATWKFTFAEVRNQIIQELAENGELSLLCNFMPRLRLIIEATVEEGDLADKKNTSAAGNLQALELLAQTTQQEDDDEGYQTRQYRINRAVQRFIRVICRFGPVVLSLDDLQWASPSTFELVKNLIRDQDNTSLLVLGTFRSEEYFYDLDAYKGEKADDTNGSNNPAMACIRALETAADSLYTLKRMTLGNLEPEHVEDLLVDLFHSPQSLQMTSLAECIHEKTLGNSFYVIQFLRTLEKKELLRFATERDEWCWDIQEIRVRTTSTDNAVDFMVEKLQEMQPKVKIILPLLASLGTVFHVDLVRILVEEFADQMPSKQKNSRSQTVESFLKTCQREGLIVPRRDGLYQWEHDKVMEAALLLLQPNELAAVQVKVGEVLHNKLGEKGLQEHLFLIASLLGDNASTLPLNDARRIRGASLNLKAGKECFLASAFQQSAAFLENGIQLLPPNNWTTDYELSLELYSTAAETEFIIGRYGNTQLYCKEVLTQQDMPFLDKRRAYNAVLNCYRADGLIHEGKVLSLDILKKIGVKFPKRGLGLFTLASIMQTRISLKTTTDTISKLCQVSDIMMVWKMRLLHGLVYFCYQTNDQELFPLVIIRGYRFTVENGITKYAPEFLTLIGWLSVMLQDFKAGKIYVEKALKLLETVEDRKSVESLTILIGYHCVLHWQQPAEWCIRPLLRGYESGILTGDTENAGWCIYSYLEISFQQGSTLQQLKRECAFYTGKIDMVHQTKISQFTRVIWQLVLNLTGDSENNCALDGEVLNQSELQAEIVQKKDGHLQGQLDRYRMQANFWFADYSRFLDIANQTGFDKDIFAKNNPGVFAIAPLAFQISLSALIEARNAKGAERARLKGLAATYFRKIKKWGAKGNPNVAHYEPFLKAETAAQSKKCNVLETKRLFEAAIVLAESRGYKNDKALAHERYGEFCMQNDLQAEGKTHITRAIEAFSSWGAHSRSDLLAEKYADFLAIHLPEEIDLNGELSLE